MRESVPIVLVICPKVPVPNMPLGLEKCASLNRLNTSKRNSSLSLSAKPIVLNKDASIVLKPGPRIVFRPASPLWLLSICVTPLTVVVGRAKQDVLKNCATLCGAPRLGLQVWLGRNVSDCAVVEEFTAANGLPDCT